MSKSLLFSPNEHRTMHFKTTGKVVYDPIRAGKVSDEKGWCIIEVSKDEMSEYYRYQFYKKFGITLDRPSWEPHLSVLVGAGTYNEDLAWGWRNGETVEIEYSNYMFWNKNHVWVASHSDALVDIRTHYNCHNEVKDRGHITIGRIPEKKMDVIPTFASFRDFYRWDNFPFNTPLI